MNKNVYKNEGLDLHVPPAENGDGVVYIAQSCCMVLLRHETYASGSTVSLFWLVLKNTPGKRRVVPYANSEMVQFRSSFNVVQIPKSTSPSTALGVSESSCSPAFRCRCI